MMSLRQSLRQKRRTLPTDYRNRAQEEIICRVSLLPQFKTASVILGYSAFDGEVDPFSLLSIAWEEKKDVYLPRIHTEKSQHTMHFLPMDSLSELTANHFGILEPLHETKTAISPEQLSQALVLVPLVGFDQQAHRIGMGLGYYDRYFAYIKTLPLEKRPFLLGLAFDCQQATSLPQHENDILLNAIMTESYLIERKDP